MEKFKFSFKPLTILAASIALCLTLFIYPFQGKAVQTQDNTCQIADIVIETDILCWAVDAANFVIQNELFSILDNHDLRDAVKHYRFYQLVMSELNQ